MADSFFIFLNKPAGITSQKYLTEFKKKFQIRKVGHHGTLDPFAKGLLLAGINEATKFFPYIDDSKKTYQATLHLGVQTDTLDLTGKILKEVVVDDYPMEFLLEKASQLTGKILQVPPMYSAIKMQGQKLYEIARKGEVIERKAREVEIHDLKIIDWEKPFLKIEATVSRGTYIRVLAEQLAERLGTLAHVGVLERTELCGKNLGHSFDLLDDSGELHHKKIAIEDMLPQFDRVDLDERQARNLHQGKEQNFTSLEMNQSGVGLVRVFHDDHFFGLAQICSGRLIAERLMSLFSIVSATDI